MQRILSVWMVLVALALASVSRANTYNVTNTLDSAGVVTAIGGGVFNASSLRAAANAANAAAGSHIINVPAGTYSLTLGEIQLGTNANASISVIGQSTPANTIIQHDTNTPPARVLDLDPGLRGGVSVTLMNLTVAGGRNNDGNGGAGIICGLQGPPAPDTTVISNCFLLDNQVIGGASGAVGGGIQNIGGTLRVLNSVFGGNAATNFPGGAIYYNSHSPSIGTLQVVNCTFTNNTAGGIADGGGAIFVAGVSGSSLGITNCLFAANRVLSPNGNGGAIFKAGTAPLWVSTCTFLTNQVLGNSGVTDSASGGAINIASGNLTLLYSRLVGNSTAVAGHGAAVNNAATAGATFNGDNNWWAANTGPGTNLVGASVSTWLQLRHTANPDTVALGNTTTLTATFLTNSAGTFVPVGNLSTLIGLPISFGSAVKGSLSGAQTTIQPSGSATALFTANLPPTGSAVATVDGAPATAFINIPCPAFSGTLTGGATLCAGESTTISVSLSGTYSPYTVTLSNGGGIQVGPGPFLFTVSPGSTTTYTASATDTNGCTAIITGSALVTVNPAPSAPSLQAVPAAVYAASVSNRVFAPPGQPSYQWTIANGIIIGDATGSNITYNAGITGNVTVSLVLGSGPCSASNQIVVPILSPLAALACPLRTNYFALQLFTNQPVTTCTGITFDGSNYWSCSGGSTSGVRLARYDSNGVFLASYSPGLDFRSVFTSPNGTVYARQYLDPVIYRQASPGVFTNSSISLAGSSLDAQSAVVFNGAGTEFIAMIGGVVSRWDLAGNFLGTVTLQGFGTVGSENSGASARGLAALGDFWLTYDSTTRQISVWDPAGYRLGRATLSAAGAINESAYSFSYANGRAFVVDSATGYWRGFEVCGSARAAIIGAPSSTNWNTDVLVKIQGTGLIPKVDPYLASTISATISTNELRKYSAVLVYSDGSLGNAANLGNALADYVDLGGGVILSTFAMASGSSYASAGRITNSGYLPFTTAGAAGIGTSQTLIKDLPSHPLLDAVTNFNGGTASYLNTPLSVTAGSTLVAHWTSLQPLIGTREAGLGRTTCLNFYPPSSDARSDFWLASTDGARIMANALLWSGKVPPQIVSNPSNQSAVVGATISFSVAATGNSPLTYQWQKNGTNLPGATTNILVIGVNPSTFGRYRAVLSNPHGQTFSASANLNPALVFQITTNAFGAWPLLLTTADGTPLTPERAARISLLSSTNAALPFNLWTPFAPGQTLSNGLLRLDPVLTTNKSQFFRARELP